MFTYNTITTWTPAPSAEELAPLQAQIHIWANDGICGQTAFDVEWLDPTTVRTHRAFLDLQTAEMGRDFLRGQGFSESRAQVVLEPLTESNMTLANSVG